MPLPPVQPALLICSTLLLTAVAGPTHAQETAPRRAPSSGPGEPARVAMEEVDPLRESWRWARFTTGSGLPADQVYDIAETSDGTPWAATRRGLAWYDGYAWNAVSEDRGLPVERPRSLTVLADDSVLVVMGRSLYRGDSDGFERVPIVVDGVEQEIVGAYRGRSSGALVFAAPTANADVAAYWYGNGTIEPLDFPAPLAWRHEPRHGWATESGSLWINSMVGLYRLGDDGWQLEIPTVGDVPLAVADLREDPRGRGIAFISFPPNLRGIWEWEPGDPPRHNPAEPMALPESTDVGPDGEALAIFRSGVVRMRNNGVWRAIERPPLQMTNVLFLKYRADGDLWVGTDSALFLLRRALPRWAYWRLPSPSVENEILEILRTKDGSTWLATGGGVRIHRPDGSVETVTRVNGVELSMITGLAEDRDGGVWISSGSALEGAYRWDGTSWRHFGAEEGLLARLVHKIRPDRQGDLWFLGMAPQVGGTSTEGEPGAFAFDGEEFTPWGTDEGLVNGRVYDFVEASDGARWFATLGGLSRWHDGAWTHWTVGEGLRRDRVFTLAIDDADRLWFGDQGSGLGRIVGDRPVYLTMADGLVDDEVQELRFDAEGRLWISTSGGLGALDNGTFLRFDTSTGLNNLRLWPILPVGEKLYVGTVGAGVNILNLEGNRTPLPKVIINPPVVERRTSLLRWGAYPYWGNIDASAVETRFRFDNEEWSAWSTDRQTTRNDLAPGFHTFEVQAKGLFGGYSTTTEMTPLSVPRPLYLRPDFALPVGSLVALVIVLVATMTARKRRHASALLEREAGHRRDLERQVAARTEQLRRSEERLRMLLETTNVIPWEADTDTWDFTYVGPQAVKILGYPVDAWYEPGFWEKHMHPDDADFAIDFCRTHTFGGTSHEFDYRMIAADGRVVWLHDIVSVVMKNGEPATLRGFMIDITDRKESEQERIDAEAEALEHRERIAHLSRVNMLGEMATGIAHEINQPLAAVAAYTQACRRLIDTRQIDTEEIVQTLGRISDEAVRAGDILHRLKALVRKRPSELDRCDINELIRDVVRLAEVESRRRGVDIELALHDPTSAVFVDRVQIQQVVLNLIRNGMESIGDAGGLIRVQSSENGGGAIEVSVADNGAGVAEAERLFRPFFSTKEEGMGMGLSISRSIIEAHGGEIGYRPTEPRGSVFFFTLPTAEAALRARNATSRA